MTYQDAPRGATQLEQRMRDMFDAMVAETGDARLVWRAAVTAMETLRRHAAVAYGTKLELVNVVEPMQVLEAVALAHELTVDDLRGPSKEHAPCRARRHAMWELRLRRPDLSLLNVAGWLNRTCHATVVYNSRKMTLELEQGLHEKERALVERALSCL